MLNVWCVWYMAVAVSYSNFVADEWNVCCCCFLFFCCDHFAKFRKHALLLASPFSRLADYSSVRENEKKFLVRSRMYCVRIHNILLCYWRIDYIFRCFALHFSFEILCASVILIRYSHINPNLFHFFCSHLFFLGLLISCRFDPFIHQRPPFHLFFFSFFFCLHHRPIRNEHERRSYFRVYCYLPALFLRRLIANCEYVYSDLIFRSFVRSFVPVVLYHFKKIFQMLCFDFNNNTFIRAWLPYNGYTHMHRWMEYTDFEILKTKIHG